MCSVFKKYCRGHNDSKSENTSHLESTSLTLSVSKEKKFSTDLKINLMNANYCHTK